MDHGFNWVPTWLTDGLAEVRSFKEDANACDDED